MGKWRDLIAASVRSDSSICSNNLRFLLLFRALPFVLYGRTILARKLVIGSANIKTSNWREFKYRIRWALIISAPVSITQWWLKSIRIAMRIITASEPIEIQVDISSADTFGSCSALDKDCSAFHSISARLVMLELFCFSLISSREIILRAFSLSSKNCWLRSLLKPEINSIDYKKIAGSVNTMGISPSSDVHLQASHTHCTATDSYLSFLSLLIYRNIFYESKVPTLILHVYRSGESELSKKMLRPDQQGNNLLSTNNFSPNARLSRKICSRLFNCTKHISW